MTFSKRFLPELSKLFDDEEVSLPVIADYNGNKCEMVLVFKVKECNEKNFKVCSPRIIYRTLVDNTFVIKKIDTWDEAVCNNSETCTLESLETYLDTYEQILETYPEINEDDRKKLGTSYKLSVPEGIVLDTCRDYAQEYFKIMDV